MKKRLSIMVCLVAFAMVLGVKGAEAILITFTENGMAYTNTEWQNPPPPGILPYDEFEEQGIWVTDVYQWGDGRDPWDGVGISPAPPGDATAVGVIEFIVPTNAVTIDWWFQSFESRTVTVEAYDASGAWLDSFSYTGSGLVSGTDLLEGAGIAQITFTDPSQYAWPAVSSLEFQPIPEPTTVLVLGGLAAGLAGARKLTRRK